MSKVIFDGARFVYTGDDGKSWVLLDLDDVYGNHSAVSMQQKMIDNYGRIRQQGPFRKILVGYIKTLAENQRLGHIVTCVLILRELLKKQRPFKVLKVGGSSADAFSMALSRILNAFHSDNLLCCMESGTSSGSTADVLVLPLDMKGVQFMRGQFSAIVLDDMQGDLPDLVAGLLPSLEPWSRFFCMTRRPELLLNCQKLLPEARTLQAEGNFSLLTHICTYKDLLRAFSLTSEGKLIKAKKEIRQRLDSLLMEADCLEYLDRKEAERMMHSAKDLEFSMSEIYSGIASVDAKRLATQFREALIDWQLGNAGAQRVRACLSALREDWLRYEENGL